MESTQSETIETIETAQPDGIIPVIVETKETQTHFDETVQNNEYQRSTVEQTTEKMKKKKKKKKGFFSLFR